MWYSNVFYSLLEYSISFDIKYLQQIWGFYNFCQTIVLANEDSLTGYKNHK